MKVIKFLKNLAANAKIIKIIEEAKQKEPPRVETSSLSLEQLIKKEFQKNVDASELNIGFDKIYELHKVGSPESGWGVEKVLNLISSDQFKKLSSAEARKTLQGIITDSKIVQDIIKDAVSRDGALDSYEQFAYSKLEERLEMCDKKIENLKKQIEDCKKDIILLESMQLKDREGFQRWIDKKVAKEEELVRVVSLFTSDNLVSVGPVPNKERIKKQGG